MRRPQPAKAVSPVISTVIITATLLVILVISSFIATNLLEVQIQNTEFEQAKTNMMLLNNLIADVALRQGAASSIKFNQRAGGLGIYPAQAGIEILAGSTRLYPFKGNEEFYIVKYRGGSRVSTSPAILAGPSNPEKLSVDMTEPMGLVKVEVGNGAWIVLDYLRVRVVQNAGATHIFVIRLEPEQLGGSGTVTVNVRNAQTNTRVYSSIGELKFKVGGKVETLGSAGTVRITEVVIAFSIGS